MKRNKLEIMRDMLTVIKENKEIKPTPLLRKSNLSSSRFKEYYQELKDRDFIKETIKNNKHISLTKKGFDFLEKYQVIIQFIDEFEL
jgi:predicted transcriptional regulator